MNKKAIAVLLILMAVVVSIFIFNGKKKEEVAVAKEVDAIEKYGYILYDNKTELYKEKFLELKEILNNNDLNEEDYAKKIAELFVVDFYDLDSKKTNTDIGGIDFILKSAKDEFILKAQDTIYKYVENDVYGERSQELPKVKKVISSEINKENFESEKINDQNAYIIKVDITYEKDLEYPTSVLITLVHDDNKLYITEVK